MPQAYYALGCTSLGWRGLFPLLVDRLPLYQGAEEAADVLGYLPRVLAGKSSGRALSPKVNSLRGKFFFGCSHRSFFGLPRSQGTGHDLSGLSASESHRWQATARYKSGALPSQESPFLLSSQGFFRDCESVTLTGLNGKAALVAVHNFARNCELEKAMLHTFHNLLDQPPHRCL